MNKVPQAPFVHVEDTGEESPIYLDKDAPVADSVRARSYRALMWRQRKDFLVRIFRRMMTFLGIAMMGLSVILAISETHDGSPVSWMAVQYLSAVVMAFIGYRFYRFGGGLSILDLNMFD